jgi:hypothetical protein
VALSRESDLCAAIYLVVVRENLFGMRDDKLLKQEGALIGIAEEE